MKINKDDSFLLYLYKNINLFSNDLFNSKFDKNFNIDKNDLYNSLRSFFDEICIMDIDNLSDSFFSSRRRVLHERGDHFNKKNEINKCISFQIDSFNKWFDYLLSDEFDYPDWVKFWVLNGVLGLGEYDSISHNFINRDLNTISNFPEINIKALDSACSTVVNYNNKDKINKNDLKKIIDKDNFGKLYSRFLWFDNSNKFDDDISSGIWKKYLRGSDYNKLFSIIENKDINWSIKDKNILSDYLSFGDIYIYFNKDDNGDYVIPSIFMYCENGIVQEVRGNKDSFQNISLDELDIIKKQLLLFDYSRFKNVLDDMNRLRDISFCDDLSMDDLKFIYECDRKINSFGKDVRPMIKTIFCNRNIKSDYSKLYNCNPLLIGFDEDDLGKNLDLYIGDINLNKDGIISNFKCPKRVLGSFDASCLENASVLDNLTYVRDNCYLDNIKSTYGLDNLVFVGGDFVAKNIYELPSSLDVVNGKIILGKSISKHK